MNEYIQLLIETGIVEFVLFNLNGTEAPIRFNWEYLPAFPDALKKLAYTVQSVLNQVQVDRLLVPNEALPLGLAVSLQTNVPLIYNKAEREAASNLIGAYDTGQIAILIAYDADNIAPLVLKAHQVGLKVISAFSVMKIGDVESRQQISWHFGIDLGEVIQELTGSGQLSQGQAQAIYDWIAQHGVKTIPHPDSAVP